jgi:hypothetical protein
MAQRYHDAIEMSDEERKQMHDDVVNVVKMFSLKPHYNNKIVITK